MADKLKVGVIFGGQSGEHEVSLISATSIINNMDRDKYQPILIGITKEGKWLLYRGDEGLIKDGRWQKFGVPVIFPPDPSYKCLIVQDGTYKSIPVDIMFPVLHGPRGEDGTIQGVFEMAGIPYVGCGVVSSSVGMDKVVSKELFKAHGLPQCDFVGVLKNTYLEDREGVIKNIEDRLGYPCFVKPANMGSSVGISKARNRQQLMEGLDLAGRYDTKIIVEQCIKGREIECSVLGNHQPMASTVGEILPSNEFYDYDAKYRDQGASKLIIPAPLDDEKIDEIRGLAVKAFKILNCSGLARADFFLEEGTQRVLINELNTMPGFTDISMYPKLWEASGISYGELIDRLIQLALEKQKFK
ncbi:MAG TPA: D-alanine--D-alanine ligase [Clostridiales bacterium]|nr:D-alanine--D-alanine ligase [Clostridiales bacterium]